MDVLDCVYKLIELPADNVERECIAKVSTRYTSQWTQEAEH